MPVMEAIWTKLKLITVEPILFFYVLIIYLESNAFLNLIYVKSCISNLNFLNDSDTIDVRNCNFHQKDKFNNQILADATYWIRFNSVVLFFFQLFSSLYVASWTDKFGRKFPMLIPPIGTLIAASINCVLSVFIETSPAYLLISSTVSGLSFGMVGIISTTFGFASDISNHSSRTKRMLVLEAMVFAGATVGIYIAGVFLKYPDFDLKLNGFTKLFVFEFCVASLITFYILFRIPNQSVSVLEVCPVTFKSLFKLDHAYECFKTVFRPRDGTKRRTVLLLLFALLLISSGMVVQSTLSYLYLTNMDSKYWTFYQYSIFTSAQFAVEGIVLLGMPLLLYLLHIQDHFIAMLGVLSKLAGFALFGVSKNSTMVFSCIALFMFSEYPVPAIRSILSKVIDANEIGKFFAFTAILPNLSFLIGSMTLTSIFAASTPFFPGLCFICVAGLQFCALVILIYLYFTREDIVTSYQIMEHEDGSTTETCVVSSESGSINA